MAYTEPIAIDAEETTDVEDAAAEIVVNKEIELTITNDNSDQDDSAGQITLEL